jgi:hypothetical protein
MAGGRLFKTPRIAPAIISLNALVRKTISAIKVAAKMTTANGSGSAAGASPDQRHRQNADGRRAHAFHHRSHPCKLSDAVERRENDEHDDERWKKGRGGRYRGARDAARGRELGAECGRR